MTGTAACCTAILLAPDSPAAPRGVGGGLCGARLAVGGAGGGMHDMRRAAIAVLESGLEASVPSNEASACECKHALFMCPCED